MHNQGIAICFITLIVGAEAVNTHNVIRREQEYQQVAQEYRATVTEFEAGAVEEMEMETFAGPEQDWQAMNDRCTRKDETTCECAACDVADEEMCELRVLPNDKTRDESCRVSDIWMLEPQRAVSSLQLQIAVLNAKTTKFAEDCNSWTYTWTSRGQAICSRRTRHMLYATAFIAKAQSPESMASLSEAERGSMKEAIQANAGVIAKTIGSAEDQVLINKLIADAQASEITKDHPQAVAERMTGVITALVSGTKEQKKNAKAAIQKGDAFVPINAAEQEKETGDVDREMTPEEAQIVREEMADELDVHTDGLIATLPSEAIDGSNVGNNGALIEVHGEGNAAAKTVALIVLIVLAVIGAIFVIVEILATIATWLLISLILCAGYTAGVSVGAGMAAKQLGNRRSTEVQANRGSTAPQVAPGKDTPEWVEQPKASTEASAEPTKLGLVGMFFQCTWKWFTLPFILVGRAVMWVVRKIRGEPKADVQGVQRKSQGTA